MTLAETSRAWYEHVYGMLTQYGQQQAEADALDRAAAAPAYQLSIDAQNARAAAEVLVAAAGQRQAAASEALTAAYMQPAPSAPWTDADLLRLFMGGAQSAGLVGPAVMVEAKAQLAAYKRATAPVFQL
jgi:hypothetical protein